MTQSLFLLVGFLVGVIATVLFYRARKLRCPGDRRSNKPPRAWPIRDSRNRLIAYDRRFQHDRRQV